MTLTVSTRGREVSYRWSRPMGTRIAVRFGAPDWCCGQLWRKVADMRAITFTNANIVQRPLLEGAASLALRSLDLAAGACHCW